MRINFFNYTSQISDLISSNCLNIRSATILGLYYGFLIPLPIGISQLICIRTFLLKNGDKESNLSINKILTEKKFFIISLSGLIIPQLIIFCSVFENGVPFIKILIQPHIWTIIILPCLLIYWNSIKYFNRNLLFEKKDQNSFLSLNMFQTFLSTFVFQIFNPILFPNSTYTRLINLFLFRYNQTYLFLFGTVTGYLLSQLIFILFNWQLLFQIENNIPTVYRLIKRIIHNVFSSIFFIILCIYAGKYYPILRNIKHIPQIGTLKIGPNIFYNNYQPNLNILKALEIPEIKSNFIIKNNMSQYNFHICISNGKLQIIHNIPEILFDFNNKLFINTKLLNLKPFIFNEKNKEQILYKKLENDIKNLEKSIYINSLIETQNIFLKLQNKLLLYTEKNQNRITNLFKINSNNRKTKQLSFWEQNISKEFKETQEKLQDDRMKDKIRYILRYKFGSLLKGNPRIRKSSILNFLQKNINSPFILRINNIFFFQPSNKLKFKLQKNLNIPSANIINIVRNPALRLQSILRKYIKLPIFIFCKHSIRSILFQSSEWQQDWIQWKKEKYQYCKLDGEPYELKYIEGWQWLTKPLQIKIHLPFHITPWINKNSIHLTDSNTYLDIWGNEFELPSKKWKQKPSFFQPIFKSTQLILRQNIYITSAKIFQYLNFVVEPFEELISSWKDINKTFVNKNRQYKNNDNILRIQIGRESNSKQINNFVNLNESELIEKTNYNSRLFFKSQKKSLSETVNNKYENMDYFLKLILNKLTFFKEKHFYTFKLHKPLLNNSLLLNKLKISIIYQYFQLQDRLIHIQFNIIKILIEIRIYFLKIFIYLYKLLNRIIDISFYFITNFNIRFQFFFFSLNQILQNNIEILYLNSQYIYTLIDSFFYFESRENKPLSKMNIVKHKIHLSKCYILYHIWQNKSNLFVNNLLENPTHIKKSIWKQSIQLYYNYVPKYHIWKYICPHKWNNQIKKNWTKINNFISNKNSNDLNYHDILIEKINKTNKLNHLNQLIYSYYNSTVIKENLVESKDKSIHQTSNFIDQLKLLIQNSFEQQNTSMPIKLIYQYKKVRYILIKLMQRLDFSISDTKDEKKEPNHKYYSFLENYNQIQNRLNINLNLDPERNIALLQLDQKDKLLFNNSMLSLNLINPYLNSINKQIVQYNISMKKFNHFFFPENLFLTNTITNLRIIQYLNNDITYSSLNYNNFDEKEVKHNLNNYVKRSLWPIYYLENLACMNRFGIGTGNLSRFSNLRIKMYSF